MTATLSYYRIFPALELRCSISLVFIFHAKSLYFVQKVLAYINNFLWFMWLFYSHFTCHASPLFVQNLFAFLIVNTFPAVYRACSRDIEMRSGLLLRRTCPMIIFYNGYFKISTISSMRITKPCLPPHVRDMPQHISVCML